MEPPNRKPNFILFTLFLINFMIPRFFGLIPLAQNVKALGVQKSKIWQVICVFSATAFTFFYPPSLLRITANSDNLSGGVSQYVEKLHFLTTYVLAVAIYARQVFYSDEMVKLFTFILFTTLFTKAK